MDNKSIDINLYDYPLTDERIAKYPLEDRAASKLLVYKGGEIVQSRFGNVGEYLPKGSMLVFNNTRVVRARLIMHKASGARIEIFCLEPHAPADYERAFAVRGAAEWSCIVGNLKSGKRGRSASTSVTATATTGFRPGSSCAAAGNISCVSNGVPT